MQYADNYRPKLNSFGEPMRGRKYDEQNAAMEMRDEESDDMEDMEDQEEAPAPPRRKIRGVQASRMMGAGSGGIGMSGAQRQALSQAKSLARKKARMTASYGMQTGY
jgi:hypothetical protein